MKQFFKSKVIFFVSLIGISNFSHATNTQIGPVYISAAAIIATAAYGHIPGSLEISTTTPPVLPTTLTCQYDYISTRNTVAGFKEMVSIILAAELAQKPVLLNLTDDPALAAFGPRCSLIAVTILR